MITIMHIQSFQKNIKINFPTPKLIEMKYVNVELGRGLCLRRCLVGFKDKQGKSLSAYKQITIGLESNVHTASFSF